MNKHKYDKLSLEEAVKLYARDNPDLKAIAYKAVKKDYKKLYQSIMYSLFMATRTAPLYMDRKDILKELNQCVDVAIKICDRFKYDKEKLDIIQRELSILVSKKDNDLILAYDQGRCSDHQNIAIIKDKANNDILFLTYLYRGIPYSDYEFILRRDKAIKEGDKEFKFYDKKDAIKVLNRCIEEYIFNDLEYPDNVKYAKKNRKTKQK